MTVVSGDALTTRWIHDPVRDTDIEIQITQKDAHYFDLVQSLIYQIKRGNKL